MQFLALFIRITRNMYFFKSQRFNLIFPILLFLIGLLFSSCTSIKYTKPGYIQTGKASWYGPGFHGKKTSSREIYNMHDMTAAHRTLPFGTYVIVTNLNNEKTVTVKINDRGPFVKGRLIDLSYAAASALDMVGPGVIPVRIEVIQALSPSLNSQKISVQVGAFTIKRNAEVLKAQLSKTFSDVYIARFKTPHRTYYRVRIKAESKQKANSIALKLQKAGYNVFVLEWQ